MIQAKFCGVNVNKIWTVSKMPTSPVLIAGVNWYKFFFFCSIEIKNTNKNESIGYMKSFAGLMRFGLLPFLWY